MFEAYRMLGREREAELKAEAARLRPLAGRPINWISVAIVAVIVAAFAFGATVARAEVWPDGRTGAELTNQPSSPDLIERWVASHKTHVLAPDDRIRVRPSESSIQVSSPDLIERWVASHERQVGQAPQPASNSHTSEGFDWRAALVGASTTAALVLALGIGIGVTRRSRIHSAPA
ncbi:MAG: hypothetical protein M3P18_15765 [Actinomycetota bacterium]|nr:hypothetical protein [Actinomycetota bacterium]